MVVCFYLFAWIYVSIYNYIHINVYACEYLCVLSSLDVFKNKPCHSTTNDDYYYYDYHHYNDYNSILKPTRKVELFGNFINIHCLSRLVTVASYVVIFFTTLALIRSFVCSFFSIRCSSCILNLTDTNTTHKFVCVL